MVNGVNLSKRKNSKINVKKTIRFKYLFVLTYSYTLSKSKGRVEVKYKYTSREKDGRNILSGGFGLCCGTGGGESLVDGASSSGGLTRSLEVISEGEAVSREALCP